MRYLLLLFFSLFVIGSVFAAPIGPAGFELKVAHSGVGPGARHIAVSDAGDLYVRKREGKGLVALRDRDGDGVFEEMKSRDFPPGTGLRIVGDFLFFSTSTEVKRLKLQRGALMPSEEPATIVESLNPRDHGSKAIALDEEGSLYVNIGAPSNSCQESARSKGGAGIKPCPQLADSGGIWKFRAHALHQKFPEDGVRYATGLRNAVAIRWNTFQHSLYLVQHGRDQLHQLFPQYFSEADSAELPAEEFHQVFKGANFGWPYTYYDQRKRKRMIAPEYGGDGKLVSTTAKYQDPLVGFPGHWAPNDIIFYTGSSFPTRYREGAFIAFHGSWNRSPFPQEGYRVVFVPMKNGRPDGDYEDFVTGFSGATRLNNSGEAEFRPMGLAIGKQGELFVIDSKKGRIWSVSFSSGL